LLIELCEVARDELVPAYPRRMPVGWSVPCANAQSGVQTRSTSSENPSRVLIIGYIPGVGCSAIPE
jgi:hypothetical protein